MLNIIQVPNTSIGKQMSLNQEFFFHTPSHEIVSLSGKEVRYIFDYKKYKKRLGDLPVGTAIEVQSPCNPAMHLVKQDDGNWLEITAGDIVSSSDIEFASYATATILYKPE